jgi:hypothetical protein
MTQGGGAQIEHIVQARLADADTESFGREHLFQNFRLPERAEKPGVILLLLREF